MKLETDVEQRVVRWAERHGVLHTKLNLQGRRGWPDQAFWIRGGFPLLVEFKRRGEEPTPLQRFTMKQLEQLGYDVCWTDKAEEAIRWIAARIGARYP